MSLIAIREQGLCLKPGEPQRASDSKESQPGDRPGAVNLRKAILGRANWLIVAGILVGLLGTGCGSAGAPDIDNAEVTVAESASTSPSVDVEDRLRFEIILVDGVGISVDYFMRRARTAAIGSYETLDLLALASKLTYELLVRQRVGLLGVEVSEGEVQQAIDDVENSAWYAEEGTRRGLTDSEYRAVVHADLLSARLGEYLRENAASPTDTEGMSDRGLELLKRQAV